MVNDLMNLEYNDAPVRVVMRDGDPWWVAKDVCAVLELDNSSQAVTRLADDQKDRITTNDSIGRNRPTPIINESGLYDLVFTSRKPEAQDFRRWATERIVSLRKHGIALNTTDGLDEEWFASDPIIQLRIEQATTQRRLEAIGSQVDSQGALLDNVLSSTGDLRDDYVTVTGWCNRYQATLSNMETIAVGRRASYICREHGYRIGRVKHERWGQVNSYPNSVVSKAIAELEQRNQPPSDWNNGRV